MLSEDCISCGICSEICPKGAITLKRGSIDVRSWEVHIM